MTSKPAIPGHVQGGEAELLDKIEEVSKSPLVDQRDLSVLEKLYDDLLNNGCLHWSQHKVLYGIFKKYPQLVGSEVHTYER